MSNFSGLPSRSDVQDTDQVVGYRSVAAGGEARWSWLGVRSWLVNYFAPKSHVTQTDNPHSVTALQVGLGNVDNTADADKPVSTSTLTALAAKADSAALAAKADLASPTFTGTVGGITAAMIGLGNVDNTADADKPVSIDQQTALNLKADSTALTAKADLASPTFIGIPAAPTAGGGTNSTQLATTAFVKAAIDALIAGAPGALDTLKEISDQLSSDESAVSALTTVVSSKVPATRSVAGHILNADVTLVKGDVGLGNVDNTADTDKPVSAAQQTALDSKLDITALSNVTNDAQVKRSELGVANGVAPLDAGGAIGAAMLPGALPSLGVLTIPGGHTLLTTAINTFTSVPEGTTVRCEVDDSNLAITPIDAGGARVFYITLTGDATIALNNVPSSMFVVSYRFVLRQDAVGGHLVSWPPNVVWPANVIPAPQTAYGIAIVDLFTIDGGFSYVGVITATVAGDQIIDTFDRANGSNLGTSSSGPAWTAQIGEFDIASNKAVTVASIGECVSTIPNPLVGDFVVSADITTNPVAGGTSIGLVTHYVDASNYMFAIWASDSGATLGRIYKRSAGSFTSLGSVTSAAGANTLMTLACRVNSESITLFRDGICLLAYRLTPAEETQYGAHTDLIGLRSFTSGIVDLGGTKIDNFRVRQHTFF